MSATMMTRVQKALATVAIAVVALCGGSSAQLRFDHMLG